MYKLNNAAGTDDELVKVTFMSEHYKPNNFARTDNGLIKTYTLDIDGVVIPGGGMASLLDIRDAIIKDKEFRPNIGLLAWDLSVYFFLSMGHKFGIVPDKLFKGLTVHSLKGKYAQPYEDLADRVFQSKIKQKINPIIRDETNKKISDGYFVILCSNTIDTVGCMIAKELGAHATLCNRLEIKDNKFTGKFENFNYGGYKKSNFIKVAQMHDLDFKEDSEFVTDSFSDLELLELFKYKTLVDPDIRLMEYVHRDLRRNGDTNYWRVINTKKIMKKKHQEIHDDVKKILNSNSDRPPNYLSKFIPNSEEQRHIA